MWGDNREAYNQVYNDNGEVRNEGSFGHEVLAGGAAFAAMKVFEDRQRKEGKPVSHQFAKELLAGIAGGEVDKIAETKGEDWYDREKAQHEAKRQAERMYDDHYGGQDQYDPNQQQPHREMQQQWGNNQW